MTARWRFVPAAEAETSEGRLIARGIYRDNDLRLIVLRANLSHVAANAFGRDVADLLNTHDEAEETIRQKDQGPVV